MLNSKTVAVVIPAYNEEKQIIKVLNDVPDFVDKIIVVNDGSKDNTAGVVLDFISKDQNGLFLPKPSDEYGDSNFYNAEKAYLKFLEKEDKKLPEVKWLTLIQIMTELF